MGKWGFNIIATRLLCMFEDFIISLRKVCLLKIHTWVIGLHSHHGFFWLARDLQVSSWASSTAWPQPPPSRIYTLSCYWFVGGPFPFGLRDPGGQGLCLIHLHVPVPSIESGERNWNELKKIICQWIPSPRQPLLLVMAFAGPMTHGWGLLSGATAHPCWDLFLGGTVGSSCGLLHMPPHHHRILSWTFFCCYISQGNSNFLSDLKLIPNVWLPVTWWFKWL